MFSVRGQREKSQKISQIDPKKINFSDRTNQNISIILMKNRNNKISNMYVHVPLGNIFWPIIIPRVFFVVHKIYVTMFYSIRLEHLDTVPVL